MIRMAAKHRFHELKILTPYFLAVKTGYKRFEVRKHDRDYQIGDILVFREYDPNRADCYSGDIVKAKITYILLGGKLGIEPGYCVLSIVTI